MLTQNPKGIIYSFRIIQFNSMSASLIGQLIPVCQSCAERSISTDQSDWEQKIVFSAIKISKNLYLFLSQSLRLRSIEKIN